MKLKYRLRNLFFPRHHSPQVREIAFLHSYVIALVNERERYRKMMSCGYIGDSLWENYHIICREISRLEIEIANRKRIYVSQNS